MTLSTTDSKAVFDGNGVTTVFPVTFPFFSNSHIKVYSKTSIGAIVEVVTGFTIYGAGSESGGSVTMDVAPEVDTKLIVSREIPLTQSVDLRNQGKFFAETHEDEFDFLTMGLQQLAEQVDRSVKVDISGEQTADDLIEELNALAAAAFDSATSASASATSASASAAAAESAAESIPPVQTTPVDVTPGAVLTVGAFGLGAPLVVTDANAVPIGGSVAILNTPFTNGPTAAIYTLFTDNGGVFGGSQLAIPYGTTTGVYRRTNNAGVWGAWVEIGTDLNSLGKGQTWQDVTGSRALSTTYTNSTGRPIEVAVSTNSLSNTSSIAVTVAGVLIINDVSSSGTSGDATFIVPAGATYSVASGKTLNRWAELR